jgi:hypothetical protein
MGCGRHPIHHRRERFGCHAVEQKPRERCVLMETKSIYPAQTALMSSALVHGSPHGQGSVLRLPSIGQPQAREADPPVDIGRSAGCLAGALPI